MKRTGEILKKAREEKGLSINEIALSLKISSKVLKAIEEGDTAQLPAKTFLRGFVQSYASYLRLDVNQVLKIFHEEVGTTKPSPLIQMPEQDETLGSFERKNQDSAAPRNGASPQEKPFNSLAKNNNSKTVTYTVLGLVLVGLIVFTKKMIDKYQKEGTVSEVEVTTPLATPTPAEISTTASPVAEAAAGMTQATSPTPALTASLTPTPKVLVTPSPTATLAPTTTPTPTPVPSATPAPTPTPSPTPSPSPSPTATPANKPVEVIIEALDNVEIDYATKDGKGEKITLAAEQVHTFKSKDGLKLNISNGGAVNVIVNGKDLGIPGNLGKPVKLNF